MISDLSTAVIQPRHDAMLSTGVALAIFNFSRVYTWTWEDMPLENLNQSRIVANESQHNIAEIRGVLACSGCHVDKT